MTNILPTLLRKEFRQIFRNKAILAMVIVMPVVQLLILPLAANYEVRNINLAVVDRDHSVMSSRLITTLTASGYFRLVSYAPSYKQSLGAIDRDQADILLEIPDHFERNLVRDTHETVLVAANAINGVKANLGTNYLVSILHTFNEEIQAKFLTPEMLSGQPTMAVTDSNWFNPLMNYRLFMVPGILAVLVTMIGCFLTALNIVKEKEVGTIEQINVTPLKKHHFILGKLLPFWVLGNVVFTVGLVVASLVYGIIPRGSLLLLYGFLAVYLICVLGLGLLVSTYCDTQQQAMFIMFFFMMIFILLGGLFTSVDSMPEWAQWVVRFNPVSYLIQTVRMIILKGSQAPDIFRAFVVVAAMGVVLNGWAIMNYRKTT